MTLRSRKIKQLIIFYLFFAVYIAIAINTASQVGHWLWAITLAPIALYVADAITGLLHFYCDYVPCRPGQGLKDLYFYTGDRSAKEYLALKEKVMKRVTALEEVMFDFKVHHPRPLAMARRSTVSLLLTGTVFVGTPLIAVVLLIKWLGANPELQFFIVLTALCLMFGQYAHACAHQHSENRLIKILQKIRIFIPPEIHDHHHIVLDRDFAVLNGWSNPAVNVLVKICFDKGWVNAEGLEPK